MRILADSTLCARPLTPRATCRACLDVCPRGAISIGTEVAVSDACDGCGLCVAACPNGVFEARWNLEGEIVARGDGRHVVIACDGADQDGQARVPCLGALTVTAFVAAALRGVERVEAVHGDCDRCVRRAGIGLFRKAVGEARSLLGDKAPDVAPRPVPSREFEPGPPRAVSRRGVFSLVARPWAHAFGPRGSGNERRARLLGMLGQVARDRAGTDSGLFHRARVTPACTGCPVCEAVCPMKAVRREVAPDAVTLCFDSRLCTGCDNCRAACPEGALSLEPGCGGPSALDEVSFAIPSHPCPSCGTPTGSGRALCLACEGRQARTRLAGSPRP